MKIEYKDFIGFYQDVYPEGYCKHLIKEFDKLQDDSVGGNRQKSENALRHNKDDYQIGINMREHTLKWFEGNDPCVMYFDGLQRCFDEYTTNYSVLRDSPIRASVMKMQKTGSGGGYHVWHPEQGPGEHSRRVLVYMLYLNTLSDKAGGETEFLYQRQRIKPEENLMLLWPAAYTHTHRGNLTLTDEYKYIVTGWFYFD